MERLIVLEEYKLPCEQVRVDAAEMYEVYQSIKVEVDDVPTNFIITEIIDEGLVVELIN